MLQPGTLARLLRSTERAIKALKLLKDFQESLQGIWI